MSDDKPPTEEPAQKPEKKVDEAWKKQARVEKERIARETPSDEARRASRMPIEASFLTLITSLVTQALMGLGEVANPIDRQKAVDLDGAKFAIDMIQVLKDKTQGNLAEEEAKYVETVLYDLRLRFVAAASPASPTGL